MSVLMARRLTLLAPAMLVLASCAAPTTGPGEEPAGLGSDVIALSIEQPPALLPVGFQIPLRAYAVRRDGAVSPSSAQWSVDRPDVVQLGANGADGVARAVRGDGTVRISANQGNLTASVQVKVVTLPGRLAVDDMYPGSGGSRRVFIVPLDGSPAIMVGGPGDSRPAWSPDGTQLAFSCADEAIGWIVQICLSGQDGSGRRSLVTSDAAQGYGPSWFSDGRRILYSHNNGIWSVGVDGADPTRLTTPVAGQSVYNARAQPGGSRLAFEQYLEDTETSYEVYRVCTSTDLTLGQQCLPSGQDPAWSPDGSKLAAIGGGVPDGGLMVLTPDLRRWWGLRTLVPTTNSRAFSPTWSPDSEWIAFTRHPGDGGSAALRGIWAIRADGTNLVKLAFGTDDVSSPAWGK